MGAFTHFNPEALGFDGRNALALGWASKLAYEAADKLLPTLHSWGFPEVRLLDRGGTQGFLASNDRMLLIAFRGTEPEPQDILTDINLALTPGPVGQVHTGFARALQRVWADLQDQYDGLYQGQPVWLTGHSLGAALATLATAYLVFHPGDRVRVQGLYTYGSPRVGDDVFAKEFDRTCRDFTFRFRNNNDVVTRVPLPGIFHLRYRHVGRLGYFGADGRLRFRMTPWELLWDRFRGRLKDLGKPGTDGMKDHAMDAYLENLESNQNVAP